VLTEHLLKIAAAENIKFSSPKVAQKLAELGKGSVRDALSIFDQVLGLSGENVVSEQSLSQALGLAGTSVLKDLLTSILTSQPKTCSQIFQGLIAENIDLKKLCDQILDGFYRIINSIDDQQSLYKDDVIAAKSLEGITIAELFWIYESMVKDFTWALTSLNPEKVILIQLQKICLRRSILTGEDVKVEEVPQGRGKSEARESTKVEEPPKKMAKTWNDFLSYLRSTSPGTAANLERGNLLQEVDLHSIPLSINVAFPEDASVFKEYLEDKEIYARLKNHLSDFFEVEIDKILFKSQLLTKEEKIDKNFKTKVEIDTEKQETEEEERKQKILNDPYVKEAQKLFNAKVDKIVLNK